MGDIPGPVTACAIKKDWDDVVTAPRQGLTLEVMIIPDDRLDDFILAFERARGRRLSRDEAREAAMRVLSFVQLLLKTSKDLRV